MNRLPRLLFAAMVSVTLCHGVLHAEDAASADTDAVTQLFEQIILPALQESCYSCHSQAAEATEGGLELDTPSGLRKGGIAGRCSRHMRLTKVIC